jgi:PAS domain S-box-containing protein
MSSSHPSEHETARFFEASPTALAVIGFDGALRHVNAAWVSLLGRSDSLLSLVQTADRPSLTRALETLQRGGACQLRLGFSVGVLSCELSSEPGGSCIYCAARSKEERVPGALLRTLDAMEAIGLYMTVCEEGQPERVVYANAGAARISKIEDLQARARAADLTHAEVQRMVAGITVGRTDVDESQRPAEFETRLADGRAFVWVALPVEDAVAPLRGHLLVSRDITARKRVENEAAIAHDRMKRSEREFRRLLEHVPDGIVVMRDGKFAYANPAAARILGYDAPEELIGVHFASIVRPEELAASDERVRQMGGNAPPPRRLRPMVRRDGSMVYAETLGFPTELDGEPATLVIAHDVTEERRLEAQMRQNERLASLGTLAATVAHEINNPITYILLNLKIVSRWLGQLATATPSARLTDAQRLIEESVEGADRVRVVVADLRDFSRADHHEAALVDVREVLDSVLPMAEAELGDRAVLVRQYTDADPEPRVRANATLLGHVFLNLLVNAAQAIDEDGRNDHAVRVGVEASIDKVVVTVRDTGRGMSRDVLERIFEPFYTTKSARAGTGLGLSLCLQRVRALGGDIGVASEVGVGSTFTVTLPLGVAGPETDAVDAGPPVVGPVKVLVVDDEPRIGAGLADLLSMHDVEAVSTGRQALARLLATDFDVVFCDLMMPDLKGTEVFEEACRAKPELAHRFIFMTAGAFTPHARALLDRGGSPRLDKPFTESEVHHVLALVVAKSRRG